MAAGEIRELACHKGPGSPSANKGRGACSPGRVSYSLAMLPCIACSRHVGDDDDDDGDVDDEDRAAAASSSSSTIAGRGETKTLTSQLKCVVLKISSSYRQCRPCSSFRAANHTLASDELFVATSDASSSDGWSNASKNRKQHSDSEGTTKGKVSSSPRSSGQLSCSTRNSNVTTKTEAAASGQIDEDTGQEWVAQVEPGVLITFLALPNGENELKRIRFSRDMFNKWQAESWWSENCERVHELYNVAGSDHSFPNTRKEANGVNRLAEQQNKDMNSGSTEGDAKLKQDTNKSLQADELTEWVEEDEPGVYITVKIGPNGRELKRVRFSREKFSEKQAKLWWEKNRFRIHDQYL